MFFQLSLPSTPPATEAAGDSMPPELGGVGTLTVPARERPAQSLAVVTRATESALVLEGLRGEAAPVAESLLESV